MEIRVSQGILGRDVLRQKFQWLKKRLAQTFVVCFGADLEIQYIGASITEFLPRRSLSAIADKVVYEKAFILITSDNFTLIKNPPFLKILWFRIAKQNCSHLQNGGPKPSINTRINGTSKKRRFLSRNRAPKLILIKCGLESLWPR